MNEPLKSITMTLPQSSIDRLEALKTIMEADDLADVLRNALRLFECIISESEKDSKFFIQREGGEVEPFEMFPKVLVT